MAATAASTSLAEAWTKNLKATIKNRGGRGAGRGQTAVRIGMEQSQPKTDKPPPTSLPSQWTKTAEEEKEKKLRWAKFAGFMSKPFNYTSVYKSNMQGLDAKGCINLKRLTRLQWPLSMDIAHIACIFYCPYEGLEGELSIAHSGINIVDDAELVAQTYLNRGYRVVYIQDPTVNEFTSWFDFFLEDVGKDIVVYFIGYGKKVLDENGDAGTCLLLYNQSRKKGTKPPPAVTGATDHTLSEDYLYNNIAGVNYPEKNITFYFDLYKFDAIFQPSPPEEVAALEKLKSSHSTPPSNTVIIESIVDLSKAKETAKKNKSSAMAASLANDVVEKGFFSSIISFVSTVLSAFADGGGSSGGGGGSSSSGGSTTVTTAVPPSMNPAKPTQQPIPPQHHETPITQVIQTLQENNTPVHTINALPPADLSPGEKKQAQDRWNKFTAEMKKPAAYTSEYKSYLTQLDGMGAINLDRVTRAQIPDIEINRCVALFFNPYEGLPHTLEAGPVNDGITMATLLKDRGYHIVYLMDGTPKEYYTWMDWLLDNVVTDLIVYFSGHGTQTKDLTGKETDGLSELLVFYDESKKKDNQGKRIRAQTGITEMTISDDLMHELIISKQYPETRIILISDCCHSGTMYDFDQPIDPSLEHNKPPLNVICIGAAKDSQTAKQTVLGGKESGVFTYNFSQLLSTKKATTFNELQTYMNTKISKYQDILITTTHASLLAKAILTDG